ncbi:MAG TPA: hypothetical protein VHL11_25325, partial [Phototrophicaceae bacterium]|nr:hypothetical protein [Phototrophicaceae bacterium]
SPDASPVRLLQQSAFIFRLAWSPDSKSLAFSLSDDAGWQSYIINLDQMDLPPQQLTYDIDKISPVPVWSPDGKQLAYVSETKPHFAPRVCN